jgi:dipeptidyl aminopeptidase/acylaminoacyl peptidase
VYAGPDWLVLHDLAPGGKALLTRNSIKLSVLCQVPGQTAERDLTWGGGSQVKDVTLDGQHVVFEETLFRIRLTPIFSRNLNGTPAIRLGDGTAFAVSPDNRWTLALVDRQWVLLPNGAGSARTLAVPPPVGVQSAGWLPDGKHIVFSGGDPATGEHTRVYVQAIDGGPPRPITSDVITAAAKVRPPDGQSVLGLTSGGWSLYPVDGGSPRAVPGLTRQDFPLQWSADGRTIYAAQNPQRQWPSSRQVDQIDVATGRRSVWKVFSPSDPVGVDNVGPIVIAPDGTYCYSYMRRLGGLFTVEGLK